MRGLSVVLALVACLWFARPAEAYLDPGTGSYVFQMVAAAVLSVGFVARAYWQRLRALFRRRRPPTSQSPPDEH